MSPLTCQHRPRTTIRTHSRTLPPVPAQRVAPWAEQLSRRESEVLHLVARGLSNAEIAEALFVSPATVKSHVARLLAKLGARDRVQLVVRCYRSGFVAAR